MATQDHIDEAKNWITDLLDEILDLDYRVQMFERIAEIVGKNSRINARNDVMWLLAKSHWQAVFMTARRLVDKDSRTRSLVRLLEFLKKNCGSFTKEWFCSRYKAEHQAFASRDWRKFGSDADDHLCPNKLEKTIQQLQTDVAKCKEWVDKTIAHMDKTQPVPATTDDFRKAVNAIKDAAKDLSLLLHAREMHMSVYVDGSWEEVLRTPWLREPEQYPTVRRMECEPEMFRLSLSDGRELAALYGWFPELESASPEQKQQGQITNDHTGVYWEDPKLTLHVTGLLVGSPACLPGPRP